MKGKPTAVFVASNKPGRYSYIAVQRLLGNGHPVFPIGFREGKIHGLDILTDLPAIEEVHTVTLYINPQRQPEFYEYLLSLSPQRIIFNPGTENLEFQRMAEAKGVETVAGCTLVMLSAGLY